MRISDWSSDVCSSDLIIEVDRISRLESQPFETEHHHEIAAIERNHIGRHMAGIGKIAPGLRFSGQNPPGRLARRQLGGGASHARNPCASSPRPAAANRNCRPTSRGSRSEEHTSELQSLMRISYAVFFLKKKKYIN